MKPEISDDTSVQEFVNSLRGTDWFECIGKPTPDDGSVNRINTWDEWDGSLNTPTEFLHLDHQALYDELMSAEGLDKQRLTLLWDGVQNIVLEVASQTVPYDPKQDYGHGPTLAVWQAGWTAGLVALCLFCKRPIPEHIKTQWAWYARGHWPSGYATDAAADAHGPLVVF